MVSRRQALAAAGGGVGLGVTGVTITEALHRGIVYEKWIRGRRDGEGDDLHAVIADKTTQAPYVTERFDDADVFTSAQEREPVVTEEMAGTLREQYDDLEYGVIVSTTEAREVREGGAVPRETFNGVQVFQEATAIAAGGYFRLL